MDRGEKLGIEYKHYEESRRVDVMAVDQVLRAAAQRSLSRVALIARPGSAAEARAKAAEGSPIQLQLFDFGALRAWATRVAGEPTPGQRKVVAVVAEFSRELARIVAHNPEELDYLEWRDLACPPSRTLRCSSSLSAEAVKIVNLCRTYVKAEMGLWRPVAEASVDILFSETVGPGADELAKAST